MADIFFVPDGDDAIEGGSIIDDDGQRFMTFRMTDKAGETCTVAMLIPAFQRFARYVTDLADASATRDYWRKHRRG